MTASFAEQETADQILFLTCHKLCLWVTHWGVKHKNLSLKRRKAQFLTKYFQVLLSLVSFYTKFAISTQRLQLVFQKCTGMKVLIPVHSQKTCWQRRKSRQKNFVQKNSSLVHSFSSDVHSVSCQSVLSSPDDSKKFPSELQGTTALHCLAFSASTNLKSNVQQCIV